MKIFVAGSGRDRKWASTVIELLNLMGYQVFNWANQADWDDLDAYERGPIAEKDLKALHEADVFLWIISNNRSRGAAFEAGVAFALNKPAYVLEMVRDDSHIYPSMLQPVSSITEFLSHINGGNYTGLSESQTRLATLLGANPQLRFEGEDYSS